MLRFVISLLFFCVIGRWLYAELELIYPRAVPAVDRLLAKVEIPTHDQWSREQIARIVQTAISSLEAVQASIESDTDKERLVEEKPGKMRLVHDSFEPKRPSPLEL